MRFLTSAGVKSRLVAQQKCFSRISRRSHANFCNANSTREEVVLNFGVNKSWERGQKQELEIELNHRIVLSPFAAKRLTQLLQQLMKEYETRYGALSE
ncbi:MAG TPA: DUF3467 domain-containing protein [Steroidobacteraceae bacterium]|nr:DUF3467 domain-containing protein [Steroidobacteraceae bacterium]